MSQITLSAINPLPLTVNAHQVNVKKYFETLGAVYGWFLSCFGRAIYVHNENNPKYNYYIDTRDLVRELCKIPCAPVWQTIAYKSEKLRNLILEHLQPVIGVPVTAAKVNALFDDFRSTETLRKIIRTSDADEAEAVCAEQLKKMKYSDLTKLPYDPTELTKHLEPGDILFRKLPDDTNHIVVFGQKLGAPFIRGKKEREGYKFNHAAIYLGNGQIAEAVPAHHGDDLRIKHLSDTDFAIAPKSGQQYMISRCADRALAQTAAEIAARTVQMQNEKDEHTSTPQKFKYTKFEAIRSVYHLSSFGPFARYRYLKQYLDDHNKHLPKDFVNPKNFFCSYFVGYCYQTAESRTVMPGILGENDGPIKGISSLDFAIVRGLWARFRRIQLWSQMSEKIKMQFDAKRLTPHDLRNFVIRNPDKFKDVYLVST